MPEDFLACKDCKHGFWFVPVSINREKHSISSIGWSEQMCALPSPLRKSFTAILYFPMNRCPDWIKIEG